MCYCLASKPDSRCPFFQKGAKPIVFLVPSSLRNIPILFIPARRPRWIATRLVTGDVFLCCDGHRCSDFLHQTFFQGCPGRIAAVLVACFRRTTQFCYILCLSHMFFRIRSLFPRKWLSWKTRKSTNKINGNWTIERGIFQSFTKLYCQHVSNLWQHAIYL